MPALKVICVYWVDASHYGDSREIDWLRDNARPVRNTSVGFAIKENRELIIIAHEVDEQGRARNTTVIQRKDVIKVEYLKPVVKK